MADVPKPQPRKDDGDRPKRRQYNRPALTEYGPISKLTRSGGTTRTEITAPRMRMGCL